jgi:cyclophilin family peptidyl-prolyl cis-trans isomerase
MKRLFLFLILSLASIGTLKAQKKDTTTETALYASIYTKVGVIEIELFEEDAPKTVKNFVELSKKKYYNGVIFHRIAKGFVIQGGDPTGTGSGGQSIYGKEFEDELNPKTKSYQIGYKRGVVAMANRGPNTNTSQFFILLSDAPGLPKKYTIFGKVAKGMNVVDEIAKREIIPVLSSTDGRPKDPIAMDSIVVQRKIKIKNSIFD